MRNKLRNGLILLGVAGLSLGFVMTQTPDGETPANEGICDELHGGTPGLYGLCVAFCEAHDCQPDPSAENPFESCKPGSRKVLNKYNQKKKAGDPEMPCLATAECPCFTQGELDSIPPQDVSGEYTQCDSVPPVTNIISTFSPANAAQVDGNNSECFFFLTLDDGSVFRTLAGLTDDELAACQDLVVGTIDTSPYCP